MRAKSATVMLSSLLSVSAGGEVPICPLGNTYSCRKKALQSSPSGQDTASYHEYPQIGGPCSNHHGCILEESLSANDAVALAVAAEKKDYRLMDLALRANPRTVALNPRRGLIQILDCRGKVRFQMEVSVAELHSYVDRLGSVASRRFRASHPA
jgi:hypothetical protein